jgi:hypothetical protein
VRDDLQTLGTVGRSDAEDLPAAAKRRLMGRRENLPGRLHVIGAGSVVTGGKNRMRRPVRQVIEIRSVNVDRAEEDDDREPQRLHRAPSQATVSRDRTHDVKAR